MWDSFKEFDKKNKGYLTQKEFSFVLKKVGLNLKESEMNNLLKMLDFRNDGNIYFSEFEYKLNQHGLKQHSKEIVEKYVWNDKSVKKLLLAINLKIKEYKSYEEYFMLFDKDFDVFYFLMNFMMQLKNLILELMIIKLKDLLIFFKRENIQNLQELVLNICAII